MKEHFWWATEDCRENLETRRRKVADDVVHGTIDFLVVKFCVMFRLCVDGETIKMDGSEQNAVSRAVCSLSAFDTSKQRIDDAVVP
jgi:hypothetical protein